jgi:hypothetical protein
MQVRNFEVPDKTFAPHKEKTLKPLNRKLHEWVQGSSSM